MRINCPIIYHYSFIVVFFSIIFGGCGIINKNNTKYLPKDVKAIEFVQQFEIPYNQEIENTYVGGLSGITYDPSTKRFFVISDDRSNFGPSRMYSLIWNGKKNISSVEVEKSIPLLNNMAKTFPSKDDYIQQLEKKKRVKYSVVDPEDIAYSPQSKQFLWVNEGEKDTIAGNEIVIHPSIQIMDKEGKYLGLVSLPKDLKFADSTGPQRNKSLESITISPSGEKFFITTEKPLLQDRIDTNSYDTSVVKIYQFRTASRSVESIFGYPLNLPNDPITAVNNLQFGVSALLSINDSTLLVLERLYIPNEGNKARLYKTVLKKQNIMQQRKLSKNAKDYLKLEKQLICELHEVNGLKLDNVEGMTWGPIIDGRKTLWLISDNNFSNEQHTYIYQFFVKE